jgi:hypothetical protein
MIGSFLVYMPVVSLLGVCLYVRLLDGVYSFKHLDQSPSLARTSRSSSSPLSDAPAPSNALAGSKRRFSTSSLSDEDEENRPLASRAFLLNNANESQISLLNATQDEDVMEIDADPDADSTPLEPIAAVLDMDVDSSVPPPSPGNTAPGKSAKSQMGLAHQAPGTTVRALPEKVALAAAAAEANAKAEVRRTVGGADEGLQVDRLATGVTVDAGALRVRSLSSLQTDMSQNSIPTLRSPVLSQA